MPAKTRSWKLPADCELGLLSIENRAGLAVSLLPNGCIFAIEHRLENTNLMINQLLGSPAGGSFGRILLRASNGAEPVLIDIAGPGANTRLGTAEDCFVWEGETEMLRHRVSLRLHPEETAWLWRLELTNKTTSSLTADTIMIQDVGLGERAFLMNNEAYASQYIDHHIPRDGGFGPVIMSRQNLPQDGRNPWVAHACLDGANGFSTDALQLFGPSFRASSAFPFPFGADLPSKKLQHELACAAIQSRPVSLLPGQDASWRFLGLFIPNHPEASHDNDLAQLHEISWSGDAPAKIAFAAPSRSSVQDAPAAPARAFGQDDVARLYPERWHEEERDGELLSFFTPGEPHNRHVVLRAKECIATRRHGNLLRSGQAVLPDESTLCATCWMHGVFAAQLTIGNTSLHRVFSVSRDPYNITRASGLRIMVDAGDGWQLLTVPSAFEMGLSDCRWIYLLPQSKITVRAIASGQDPAMQWRLTVEGEPCRFSIFGHLAGGEREFESDSSVEIDTQAPRVSLRPGPATPWGQRYPHAVYHLVTSMPASVKAIGGEELLHADARPRPGAYLALRTARVQEFVFAVLGSLRDPGAAQILARKYEKGVADADMLAPAANFWRGVTRNFRIKEGGKEGAAHNMLFPWLAHNAMIHLTVPHGLEQYTGAAWGTRDVCQGPVEFLLALEHDAAVKEILRTVFAQQYETRGDWPQWFMLEPYSFIQDQEAHGDIIIWPLKALNDYIEASGDMAFLDERIPWRREDNFERTARTQSVTGHVEKLLSVICERFIPDTHLIRYGHGDWNDSLQPVDPALRDWMVSSWTVALLYQQLNRYAEVLRRAGRSKEAQAKTALASKIAADFNRHLIKDGTVAGYGIFSPKGGPPAHLLHPSDTRTGLRYSLLPMSRATIGGLFTAEQAAYHLRLIREHLLFPDGARLIDRPVPYRGGPQTTFRRAESSSFFGREIGLMYVHAHLRYGEAMAVLGEAEALWEALALANPVIVTDLVTNAAPRQRNAYFSSSDAAFPDRYAAEAQWQRLRAGKVRAEGGWRIYSSGPGIFARLLVCQALGKRRLWGKRFDDPLLPQALQDTAIYWDLA
ncbi:MAG: cellobiose phosphorylase [Methylocapsa sp.]|nr:cellobiose phosphorylase [Methylocapsa sp.]